MRILVIAPHPDDETLGCGGTLLRHINDGDELYWVIITKITEKYGWSKNKIKSRDAEIREVFNRYNFKRFFNYGFPPSKISSKCIPGIIDKFKTTYDLIKPDIVYTNYAYDVHTDHMLVAKALQSTFKWFRYPSVKKVLMYETPSETEFNFNGKIAFTPNVFINISEYLEKKIEIMKIYKSEINEFPFPRSEKTMRSLAAFRGSQSGYEAAEAYELVYERK